MNRRHIIIGLVVFIFISFIVFLAAICFTQEQQQAQDIEPLPQVAVTYTSSNLRDPFVSLSSQTSVKTEVQPAAVSPPAISVEGLIWESQFPQAIISGQVVAAGDIINEARVMQIDKDGVLVSYKGRLFIGLPGGKFQPFQKEEKKEGE